MNELSTTPTVKDGDVEAWFETVTPARAEQLLKTYKTDYRKYRATYAEGLARDMASGNWNFDGSPIRIDVEGGLFDGQHRLNAVIISKVPQRFLIVSGLPVQAYDTTDTGLARNYGDTLRRRGYQNVHMRSALIKLIARWENGLSLDDSTRMTNSEMDEVLYKYADSINRAVGLATGMVRRSSLSGALLAFSFWVLSRIDNEKAYTFLVSTVEGENLRNGMPAYTLRERLRDSVLLNISRNAYMHMVFTAWNALMDGREITRILVPSTVTRSNMVMPHGPSEDA